MFIRINYNIYNILNINKIKYKKMLMDICVSSLFTIQQIIMAEFKTTAVNLSFSSVVPNM